MKKHDITDDDLIEAEEESDKSLEREKRRVVKTR
jgi:hypothetical protein